MDSNVTLQRRIFTWLLSPGVVKVVLFVAVCGAGVSYLTKLKSEQISGREHQTPSLKWVHGTSNRLLQSAIERNDGAAVAKLLKTVPLEQIRPNIVDRLAFDKMANALTAFLDAGWNPEGSLKNGQPLIVAAMSDQPKSLHILLSRGANPNVRDNRRLTPALWACLYEADGPDMLNDLARHGGRIDDSGPYVASSVVTTHLKTIRPISAAALRGNAEVVKTLLQLGASPKSSPEDAVPPLVAGAMCLQSLTLTKLLLNAGADLEAVGDTRFQVGMRKYTAIRGTALYVSREFGFKDTEKLLLGHGANPNPDGWSSVALQQSANTQQGTP